MRKMREILGYRIPTPRPIPNFNFQFSPGPFRENLDGRYNLTELGPMRSEANRQKIEAFMAALGKRVLGEGSIYLTGGATAVLHGWRAMTIAVP